MKRNTFLIVLISLFLAIMVLVVLLFIPKNNYTVTQPVNAFDETAYFRAAQSVYENSSFSYIGSKNSMPTYAIDTNYTFYEIKTNSIVTNLGEMVEIDLKSETFDKRLDKYCWTQEFSIRDFRKTTIRAWQLYVEDYKDRFSDLYLLLQQEDGSFYLCFGYYNAQSEKPKNEDDSFIRSIYHCEAVNTENPLANLVDTKGSWALFYEKTTDEYDIPLVASYAKFPDNDITKFLEKAKDLKWVNDALCDRTSFKYDGYLLINKTKIFFGFEDEIFYCNGHYAVVSQELFTVLSELEKSAQENKTVLSHYQIAVYEKGTAATVPTLKLNYTNNTFTITWPPLDNFLILGSFKVKNDKIICLSADKSSIFTFEIDTKKFIYIAEESSQINNYNFDSTPENPAEVLPDKAEFRIREESKNSGNTNVTATFD